MCDRTQIHKNSCKIFRSYQTLAGNVHGILCSRLSEARGTRRAGSRRPRSVVAAAGDPPIPSQPSSQPHINLALIHFGKEPRAAHRRPAIHSTCASRNNICFYLNRTSLFITLSVPRKIFCCFSFTHVTRNYCNVALFIHLKRPKLLSNLKAYLTKE